MTSTYRISETAGNCGHEPKFVDVNGIRTRYYEVGSGEPMVLCHGLGLSGNSGINTFAPNLAGLGQTFQVFGPDRLGSGLTDNPKSDDDYTIAAQNEHFYDFIRTVVPSGKIHLVGQSRGAYVACRLALEHPDLCKTLVLVDSATLAPDVGDLWARRAKLMEKPPADEREYVRFRQRIMSYGDEHVSDEFVEAAVYMQNQPKALVTKQKMSSGLDKQFEDSLSTEKEETLRWLGEGKLGDLPTLIYWAKDDPSALLEQGLLLFDLIAGPNPNARMTITNKAGHFHYRELPEEFSRVVTDFCTYWG